MHLISWLHTSLFLASQPICCSSPGRTGSEIRSGAITSLACTIATPVKIDSAECSVLNQAAASEGSGARRTQLWMPSGECSSKHRFSRKKNILCYFTINFATFSSFFNFFLLRKLFCYLLCIVIICLQKKKHLNVYLGPGA